MDDSIKGISISSSSTPFQPSANPRISISDIKEADENDQMLSKNQTLKKLPVKHFMTPTISATSKASILRNKILTERNESSDSSETHQQNTPTLVPKKSQVNSSSRTFPRNTPFGNKLYESDDDEHNDSSAKPYDPLTNYLSPRPKFLRFNPNKSREIYNRRAAEFEEEGEGSDDRSSSNSSSIKSNDEIENEEVDTVNKDDEEELEDIENEGCFSWTGVLKFTFVSVALLLLTWYISCMNSSAPSPTRRLIRESTRGYVGGYNSTYDIVDVGNNGEENEFNEISDHVLKEEWEASLKQNKDGGFVYSNHEEAENVNEHNFETEVDGRDQTWDGIIESAEKPKSFQDDQILAFSDVEAVLEGDGHDKGNENAEIGDKFESSEMVDTYVSESEERGNSVPLVSEVEIKEGDEKLEENAMKRDDITEEGSSLGFSSTKDSESNSMYGTFIGIFVIIASSIIAFYFKCLRTPVEKSETIKQPLCDNIPENISSKIETIPNLEEALIKKAESYVINPSTYVPRVVEENAQDFSSTRAPTVELLGEFIVGDVQSSMKSCNFKSKTKEIEVKPKEMESEGDTNSIFLDKVVNNTGNLSTPEISASTAMNSPSYGSFTDRKKIVKKEEGLATTTPVRRSSRIRNRAMSP